jgi:hypothetical protein
MKMTTTARIGAVACAVALGVGLTPGIANAKKIDTVQFLFYAKPGRSVSSAAWGRAWDLCRKARPATRSVRMVRDSRDTRDPDIHWLTWNCYDTTNAT